MKANQTTYQACPKHSRAPAQPTQVRATGSLGDTWYQGMHFRTFPVVDSFAGVAVVIEIDLELSSTRLPGVSGKLAATQSLSDVPRPGNGPGILGEAFAAYCPDQCLLISYMDPGKLNQNACVEHLHCTWRNEVHETGSFRGLNGVSKMTWARMLPYDEQLDQNSLSRMTPIEAI